MKQELGVVGLYVDEPIGMDHPFFMARTEARMRARFAAASGLPLEEALASIGAQLQDLFGELPPPLVEATITVAYLEAASSQEGQP